MTVDAQSFKDALSRWSSGVTIVTARAPDGTPVGLTASAFCSLSLEPPLILFCLGRESSNAAAFEAAQGFAVHILREGQGELSNRFASRSADRFAGLDCGVGIADAPLLPDALAVLECALHDRVPGGDHWVVMGAVQKVTLTEGAPLVYFRGGYRALREA